MPSPVDAIARHAIAHLGRRLQGWTLPGLTRHHCSFLHFRFL
jgi:hypothetical protein